LLGFVGPEHHRDVGAPGVMGTAPLEAGQAGTQEPREIPLSGSAWL
jgi:hypothetical protein